MVKARQLCLASFFLLGSAACAGKGQKADEDMIPVAKAITIYSAGGSVVSGVIDPSALGGRRLRVPASVAAINLSQGDQSLKWFTVQAIQEAKTEGLSEFDMGRSGWDNPGLILFKDRWGAARSVLAYLRYPRRSIRPSVTGLGIRIAKPIISIAPDGLLSTAGSVLYRHFA